jgi:putative oxidoreductase
MNQLFTTQADWTGLILRVFLGIIMFPHGAQKMLGWFGGYGFSGTLKFFSETMNFPWIIAFLIVAIEFIAPLGLIAGFAGRLWALTLMVIMLGAIVTTNARHGFFMNWFGNQAGEGFEYHLLVIGICLAILWAGSGRYSIDHLLSSK